MSAWVWWEPYAERGCLSLSSPVCASRRGSVAGSGPRLWPLAGGAAPQTPDLAAGCLPDFQRAAPGMKRVWTRCSTPGTPWLTYWSSPARLPAGSGQRSAGPGLAPICPLLPWKAGALSPASSWSCRCSWWGTGCPAPAACRRPTGSHWRPDWSWSPLSPRSLLLHQPPSWPPYQSPEQVPGHPEPQSGWRVCRSPWRSWRSVAGTSGEAQVGRSWWGTWGDRAQWDCVQTVRWLIRGRCQHRAPAQASGRWRYVCLAEGWRGRTEREACPPLCSPTGGSGSGGESCWVPGSGSAGWSQEQTRASPHKVGFAHIPLEGNTATGLLNQRLHLQGESCSERTDSWANIRRFCHTACSPLPLPLSLPPSLHPSPARGLASRGFPANRRLPPPPGPDGGGCAGPCCSPGPCRSRMPSDDVCIPPRREPAGGGSPGWTGRVVLLRGGLPELRQTAWGGQREWTKEL